MPINSLLNKHQHQFNTSLEGKWVTKEGSFEMQSDCFEFYKNGEGIWLYTRLIHKDSSHFLWRKNNLFTIDLKLEGNKNWYTIAYNFKLTHTDVGAQIILCERDSEYFYLATTKIGYVGKI